MSDLNLYSVNWQDGMLITQQHLQEQENYFEELARWYALDAGTSYGLVRKSISDKTALSLNISVSSGRLRVEVIRCQAITPDGSLIEINESNQSNIQAEAEASHLIVPVYIAINPITKKQVGDPDPRDDLPRVPYLVGNYSLSLGKPPDLPEGRYLQIAELTIDGNEISHSENYYPPCRTLYADERLAQKALDYRNKLENLLSLASRAYVAITAGGALSDQNSELQQAFKETIYQFAYNLSSTLDNYVVGRNSFHPIHIVIFFKKLFRTLTTLLNLQPGLKDFLNERFFVREINSEVGRFMSSVDACLLADYDHRNLGGHLRAIDDILVQVRGILGFLAQIKREQLATQAVATDALTYRGRTHALVEYATNQLEQIGELSYLLINIKEPLAINDIVILINKDMFSTGEWSSMQVRLGLNEARGLGETDPVEIDITTFGNKIALHPQDILKSPSIHQITLIFRGAGDPEKLNNMGKMDLIVYAS